MRTNYIHLIWFDENQAPMAIVVFPPIPTVLLPWRNPRYINTVRCSPANVKSSISNSITTAAVVWYKNDLRVDDHLGLITASSSKHSTVIPLYVFDHRILRSKFFQGAISLTLQFFIVTICSKFLLEWYELIIVFDWGSKEQIDYIHFKKFLNMLNLF